MQDAEVVVIGAGAAGVAAARRLADAHVRVVVLEARDRVGGRGWTRLIAGFPLDLGCGWLHSADENEWSRIAQALGFAIDPTPPPWGRRALEAGFTASDQADFWAERGRFDARLEAAAEAGVDRPASELLEAGNRWNSLLDALSTYINGVELDRLSVIDYARYHDTGTNRRVVAGYGTLIAAHAVGLDIRCGCPVTLVDHSGPRVRVETPQGTVTADAAVIAVPSSIIAGGTFTFRPHLPEKQEAADALPLGLADKLFLRIDDPELFPAETRLVGATDRAATATYHLRPFGRPVIEGYFGGRLARELEFEGEEGFARFAIGQIADRLGNDVGKHLSLITASRWAGDPFARGSYSYARVGHADARVALAAPVDDRLFFAGEACSRHDFSTAHGAYRTGLAAAEQVLQAVSPIASR
ncbi:MAG TPA: FAD-dependent oxidoreductase [Xanthobacteraceae bacterium]|nr:FAD-dependent oxidoreductase [Xanthobacteraceae bacterium]